MLIIPDLFTPYMEGVETARKANWDDLNQYNSVQGGQLENAYNMATFSPRVNKAYEETDAAALANLFNERTLDSRVAANVFDTRKKAWDDQLTGTVMPGVLAQQGALSQERQNTAPTWANAYSQAELARLFAAMAGNQYSREAYDFQRQNIGVPKDQYGNPIPNGTQASTGGTGTGMPTIPNVGAPAGTQQQGTSTPQQSAPTTQQGAPTSAPQTAIPQNQKPVSATVPTMTPAQRAVATGIVTPETQAQAQRDNEIQQAAAAREARLAELAQQGIVPGTRRYYKFDWLTPTWDILNWYQYNLVPSSEAYTNEEILNNLLQLPRYSYGQNRSLTQNPMQDVVPFPLDELTGAGTSVELLQGMQPGSYVIGGGNNIVIRDPDGRYWVSPVGKHTRAATGLIPLNLPAVQGAK